MRSEPGSEQGPAAFPRVDVDFVEAVAVFIACVLLLSVVDRAMFVAPVRQSAIDVVLVGVDRRAGADRGFQDRPDRGLLNVGKHPKYDLSRALNHAEDRRLFFGQSAATAIPFQTPSSAESPFFLTASGCPLWPATT